MIRICTCIHAGQDSIHGKGKRVYNTCKKGLAARCTVCGKEVSVTSTEIKNSKTKGESK